MTGLGGDEGGGEDDLDLDRVILVVVEDGRVVVVREMDDFSLPIFESKRDDEPPAEERADWFGGSC